VSDEPQDGITISRRALLGLGAAAPLAACVRSAARAGAPLDDWMRVRADFELEPGVINLDNGWSCPPPRAVQESYDRQMHAIARLPAHRLSTMRHEVTEPVVRPAVAALFGVPADHIALVRNATEAIGTVLLGFPLAAGDEIVACEEDYWHMLSMLWTRIEREQVVPRPVEIPIPAPSPQAIVDAYAKQITDKTKLVLVTHASNRTGQIMPVAEIAKVAHAHGAEVAVDGAQTFALLEYQVPELDGDYFACSLHKWLMAPQASGALWMRPEHTAKIPPRFGGHSKRPMERYEMFGQVAEAAFAVVPEAIAYHRRIGPGRKQARMRELVAHLRAGLRTIPSIKFYTVDEPWASCGLLTFELPGRDPEAIQKQLWDQHRVLVQAQVQLPNIRGVRLSPAIYTSVDELDRAIDAIRRVAA
jgi:selenocysteine lyase/cysteine desulfurase